VPQNDEQEWSEEYNKKPLHSVRAIHSDQGHAHGGFRTQVKLICNSHMSLVKWDGFSDRSEALRIAGNRHRSANMDPFEEAFREVSGHPHAAMGCGIPRKIAGMHADGLTELHIEWHGRGLIMESRWYVGAGSGTQDGDSA
jgi:hypothetical protein